jgi:hypothetical protein
VQLPQKLDRSRDIARPLEVKSQIFFVAEVSVLVCLQVLKRLLPLKAYALASHNTPLTRPAMCLSLLL